MRPQQISRAQVRERAIKRHELLPTSRAYICGRRDAGESWPTISKATGIPRSTIQTICSNAQLQVKYKSRPRAKPPQTSIRTDRIIVQSSLKDRRQTLGELSVNVGRVSRRTIQRRLQAANIKKWRAAQRPLLDNELAYKRLQWALLHRDWTEEQCLKVNWSDECSVEKSSVSRPVWVFRTPGEKWKKKCIAGKKKSGSIS